MENIIDEYIEELINNPDFIKLKELKKLIDSKYKNEIIAFKTAESLYIEATKYGKNHPNLHEYQINFMKAKSKLYSLNEVKEYLALERKIGNDINDDIKKLKDSIKKFGDDYGI